MPAIEAEGDAEVGEASVAITFADARAMPPSALTLRVHRHEIGRADDRELIGGEAHGRRGHRSGVFEEGAQLADGAELHRDAEAIGVAAMLGDERAIGIVEMKVPGELIGGGLARETSVVAGLAIGEKANRHRSDLLRRGLEGAFAEQFDCAQARFAFGVDVGIERRQ